MHFPASRFPLPASRFSGLAALVLATLVAFGLTTFPAHAQTILTPADSNVGAAGAPGGLNPDGQGGFYGNYGSDGYFFGGLPLSSLIVNGPALTGGAGGEITGTDAATNYAGGSGGAGLNLNGGTSYVNSGTFTGGAGGAADGIGKNLFGGAGGDGLYTNSSTANVYGGTFQGGDSGLPIGTGVLGNYSAGNGLNANDNSTVNIYGGNFTGGDQARFPGSVGFGGDGLSDEGGTVNVYGGNFTGGTGSDFGDLAILSGTTTLYGSDFFVNGVAFSGGSVTGSGTITGILQDNGFTSTFTYEAGGFGGTLNIISAPAVPEASTMVSFGLLLALGLGGLVVAARRKKIAP